MTNINLLINNLVSKFILLYDDAMTTSGNRMSVKSAWDINNGLCGDFSEDLATLLGGESESVCIMESDMYNEEIPHHQWLAVEGRYFDAECPDGVSRWEDLPIYKRFYSAT